MLPAESASFERLATARPIRNRHMRLPAHAVCCRHHRFGLPAPHEGGNPLPDKQTAPSASQVAPYLAIPSATTPAWFSDTRLAYLVDVSGVPQLWRIDLPDQG